MEIVYSAFEIIERGEPKYTDSQYVLMYLAEMNKGSALSFGVVGQHGILLYRVGNLGRAFEVRLFGFPLIINSHGTNVTEYDVLERYYDTGRGDTLSHISLAFFRIFEEGLPEGVHGVYYDIKDCLHYIGNLTA